MTRLDFLRFAEAMMKDYQNETCVGNYLRESQQQAKKWFKYRPTKKTVFIIGQNIVQQKVQFS